MIFLSKDGQDTYINTLAASMGRKPTATQDFVYEDSLEPIVLRGILKHKIMQRCWNDGRTFYYVDTGYFGNEITAHNPHGWKLWHRIVKNNLQHHDLIARSEHRWHTYFSYKKFAPWRRQGRSIMIAAPDEKPCKFYGIDRDQWIADTKQQIAMYTDRPIVVRERASQRKQRTHVNTLQQALVEQDVFALVTFNSVAATEAIFNGIPAFVLAPANAAAPVALQDLARIETPFYPDADLLTQWASHLAYGQFRVDEMRNGTVWQILQETV
jgi:hypothetical protein